MLSIESPRAHIIRLVLALANDSVLAMPPSIPRCIPSRCNRRPTDEVSLSRRSSRDGRFPGGRVRVAVVWTEVLTGARVALAVFLCEIRVTLC
jgi:hypothetical protein